MEAFQKQRPDGRAFEGAYGLTLVEIRQWNAAAEQGRYGAMDTCMRMLSLAIST
jgi:hypothetical protein